MAIRTLTLNNKVEIKINPAQNPTFKEKRAFPLKKTNTTVPIPNNGEKNLALNSVVPNPKKERAKEVVFSLDSLSNHL